MTQLHTPKASRNQETGRLSFMSPVSPSGIRVRAGGARGSLLVASATLFSLAVTAPAALAAPSPTTSPTATPPAQMSTLGGARLGMPGTQVNLAPGVPVLPQGLTARSWIVSDAESGQVLAAHNAHWRLPRRAR